MARKDAGENAAGAAVVETQVPVMEINEPILEPKREKKKITTIEQLPGVGDTTASKLRDAGYDTLEQIAYAMPMELAEAAGIGEGTSAKLVNAARESLEMGYETGDKILERRKLVAKITTGSKEFDGLLGGGVETGAITECFGRFGSSKSQIGFQLCVNVTMPVERGGLGGEAVFIDTESTFRPERIVQMAVAKGIDSEEVLKHIHVARAYNSDHQMLLVEKIEELVKKHNVRLVVVDSITSAFRNDYVGRGTLADRQQKLNKHIHMLLRLADVYNVAVYITNQVMDKPDMLFGDPTAPVGGNVLAHMSTYRIYLRRSKEDRRIAKIVDSPHLPDGEVLYRITPNGIEDVE